MTGKHELINLKRQRRSRYVWLGSLTAMAGLAGIMMLSAYAIGWTSLPGVSAADAQVNVRPDAGKTGRIAQMGARQAGNEAGQAPALRNSISRQAGAWGMTTCLPQIAMLSDFLTGSQHYSALTRREAVIGDASVFAATVAARDGSGLDTVSTFLSVPLKDDDCQSAYQTVAAFPAGCEAVRAELFAGFEEKLAFGDHVEAWHNGRGAHVYFLPVPMNVCVVVKTQLIR